MTTSTYEGMTLGKYRILEALGRGGMAQVYKAHHPQLDRHVAVKILRSDLVENDEFLKRFQSEARAVSGLRHPHIVQVMDFDVQDNIHYMVMELLEGDTLRALLNKYRVLHQRMPLAEVARIMKDVTSALTYAHGEGIVHRDIKPANIMLTKKGNAVLTDFGIAQIVGGTQYTVSGALMGTLSYMAPEQGLKGTSDDRSDIYSLGIVLYEMLTGYTPFDADTPLAILMKHLNDPLPLPTHLDATIPASIEQVVLKCLEKDPENRFQSADELMVAIDETFKGLSSKERSSIPPPSGFTEFAVLSGTSRQQITDHRFADADTDSSIRINKTGSLSNPKTVSVIDLLFSPLTDLFQKLNVPAITPSSGIFGGLLIFLLVNMIAVMTGTFSGVSIYKTGWPIEIFLIANFLAMICWGAQVSGIMIASGIVFGNGLIFTYCTLTGRWEDWVFLWMFELLFIFISIITGAYAAERQEIDGLWARSLGMIMSITCILLSLGVILTSYLING